jgi:hypothetical protein
VFAGIIVLGIAVLWLREGIHSAEVGPTGRLFLQFGSEGARPRLIPLPPGSARRILSLPRRRELWIAFPAEGKVVVLDTDKLAVMEQLAIPVNGGAAPMVASPDESKVYIAGNVGSVFTVDAATREFFFTPIARRVQDLALTRDGRTLYASAAVISSGEIEDCRQNRDAAE